jgi:hypothetical protein
LLLTAASTINSANFWRPVKQWIRVELDYRSKTIGLSLVANIPRALFSFQVRAADLAIIALFALGGWAGFPGFAKFSEIKAQVANLEYKPMWACLLFIFNYLVLYRKLGRAYFSVWAAAFHAVLINVAIAFALFAAAKLSFLSAMNWLDTMIAIQCGMAAVFLIVQNWVEFKSDIRGLGELSREIDAKTRYLENLRGTVIKNEDLKEVVGMCDQFVRDADVALSENRRNEAFKSKLTVEKAKIEAVSGALKGLLPDVPSALKRLREAVEQEETLHA